MIRKALKSDISWMVSLSHNKRKSYAEAQKQFWKMAKDSDKIQTKWFEQKNAIALVVDNKEGFVIGKVVTPPEVYDAGLTLMIDDFCVSDESLWSSTGKDLIDEIKKLAKTQMVSQILVVCGAHDSHKKSLLKQVGLATTSEWYVGGL